MTQSISDQQVKRIEQALGKDGVWISPQLKGQVTAAQEKQIEAAVAKAPTPTYVVLVDLSYDDSLTHGDPSTLTNILRDDTGHNGRYVTLDRAGDDTPELQVDAFPEDYTLYQATMAAKVEQPTDLGAQTLDLLSIMRTGKGYGARLERAKAQHPATYKSYYRTDTSHDGAEDGGHGVAIGISIGAVIVVLALLATIARALVRKRSRATPTRSGSTFTLPKAVLSTVRAAEDREREHDAQREVLALGEAIDRTDLKATTPAAQASWQAALDHYDAARRILDRDHSPADVVGALVLARRGSAALDAAKRDRTWTPRPVCYFNPLHPRPGGEVTWTDGDRSVEVPACDACAAAVRAGREPEDVLDFVSDGKPRHYFKLDLGVWSSTGYGALDTDLLGRLLER